MAAQPARYSSRRSPAGEISSRFALRTQMAWRATNVSRCASGDLMKQVLTTPAFFYSAYKQERYTIYI